jgi:putative ABC transport system permease protein
MAWPDKDPIGKRFGSNHESLVVGLVEDPLVLALDEPSPPIIYSLVDNPRGCVGDCNRVNYFARAPDGDPARVATSIGMVIRAVPGSGILHEVSSVGHRLRGSITDRSFATLLITLFAGIAAIIAVCGMTSHTGFLVRTRTRELALRMSLGAQPADILRTVLGQMLIWTFIGIVIGLVGTLWLSQSLAAFVYGISPSDPATLTAGVMLLVAVVFGATLFPAARALRIPLVAVTRSGDRTEVS